MFACLLLTALVVRRKVREIIEQVNGSERGLSSRLSSPQQCPPSLSARDLVVFQLYCRRELLRTGKSALRSDTEARASDLRDFVIRISFGIRHSGFRFSPSFSTLVFILNPASCSHDAAGNLDRAVHDPLLRSGSSP